MIVTIGWQLFVQRFMKQYAVYVLEDDISWSLYTQDNNILIKCVIKKSENMEENMMFVDRYLANRGEIYKVLEVKEHELVVMPKGPEQEIKPDMIPQEVPKQKEATENAL